MINYLLKQGEDIFKKCYEYNDAKKAMSMGLYPYFREISSEQDTEVWIGDRKMLMLGSNSYMGLTNHPEVKEASKRAVSLYGTGNAGSRFLNGTLKIHRELEEKLADFCGKESALLYGTGYQANLGVISGLCGPKDYIYIDKMNHASIIDGCRLSFAKVLKYKHNDVNDLERLIHQQRLTGGSVVVADGVFSMEGDIVNLNELVELKKKHQFRIMIDDAHSLGVLGKNGEGTARHFDLDEEVDLILLTFSKSLASLGGAVLGDEEVIHYLKHHSRALIFSASIPAGSVASVSKALDIIGQEPERLEKLWKNTRKMKKELEGMGYDTGVSESPIIPILMGSQEDCFRFWRMLTDDGIFVNPIVPPAVGQGNCLIRTSYMATHTDGQLDRALESFYRIGKKLNKI